VGAEHDCLVWNSFAISLGYALQYRGMAKSHVPQRHNLSIAHLVAAILVTLVVSIDIFGPVGRYWHRKECTRSPFEISQPKLRKEYVEDEHDYLKSMKPSNGKTHSVKFTSDVEWEEWSLETQSRWASMLPKDPLGQDDDFNDGIPYGLGMHHQVHCLFSIRRHYTSLLHVNGTTEKDRDEAMSDAELAHVCTLLDQVPVRNIY
jgi:hypothetical protein